MLIYYLSLIDDPRDDEKFIQIYELYRNSMFNKANSILHNVQDAEDAVQEAFISIAKNRSVTKPEDSSLLLLHTRRLISTGRTRTIIPFPWMTS